MNPEICKSCIRNKRGVIISCSSRREGYVPVPFSVHRYFDTKENRDYFTLFVSHDYDKESAFICTTECNYAEKLTKKENTIELVTEEDFADVEIKEGRCTYWFEHQMYDWSKSK